MTTDTNQTSELFELCKDVYKRTKLPIAPGMFHFDKDGYVRMRSYGHGVAYLPGNGDVPLYTSDYLLEKLPKIISDGVSELTIIVSETTNAGYSEESMDDGLWWSYRVEGDTPLKALLKLTIALSEAGELDNDQSS